MARQSRAANRVPKVSDYRSCSLGLCGRLVAPWLAIARVRPVFLVCRPSSPWLRPRDVSTEIALWGVAGSRYRPGGRFRCSALFCWPAGQAAQGCAQGACAPQLLPGARWVAVSVLEGGFAAHPCVAGLLAEQPGLRPMTVSTEITLQGFVGSRYRPGGRIRCSARSCWPAGPAAQGCAQ